MKQLSLTDEELAILATAADTGIKDLQGTIASIPSGGKDSAKGVVQERLNVLLRVRKKINDAQITP